MVLFETLTQFLEELDNMVLTLFDSDHPPKDITIQGLGMTVGNLFTLKMLSMCKIIGLPDQEEETQLAEKKTASCLKDLIEYIYSGGP